MATFNAVKARQVVFQLHLWIALVLTIPLVLLGLTGSALMMPQTLNRLTNPTPAVAPADQATKPASAYLDAARAAMPAKAKITGVKMPTGPGVPVAVAATTGAQGPGGGRTVWVDPATAQVLKITPSTAPIFAWSHDFHGAFLVQGPGRTFVGWAGVAMFFLSLSGIWLWWPRGAFAKAFRWRRTPDTMNNLHHMAGFWLRLPLAGVSRTGGFISSPSLTNAGFGAPPAAQGQQQGRPAESGGPGGRQSGPPRQTADQAVGLAEAAYPGATFVGLTLPGVQQRGPAAGPRNAWRVELMVQGKPSTVLVNDATSEVTMAPPQGPRGGGQAGSRRQRGGSAEGGGGGSIERLSAQYPGGRVYRKARVHAKVPGRTLGCNCCHGWRAGGALGRQRAPCSSRSQRWRGMSCC
jgi:uncharacterized iron-regulated membrane protein